MLPLIGAALETARPGETFLILFCHGSLGK